MDPKIVAIMAKLANKEKVRQVTPVDLEEADKPPTNLEEYLQVEGWHDWPHPVSGLTPLNFNKEGTLLGSQEDIADILREAAPLGLHMLEKLEDRLMSLEEKLVYFAERIVTDNKRESRLTDRLFHSPSRTFMTEVSESDAVKSHSSARGHKSIDFVDSLMETRKKSLDYCCFPGFRHGELVELPGQLEAPPILNRVTNAQDFNSGFKKFWKKLFLSEASVAVMQDTFWWVFLDRFNTEKGFKKDKNRLFDRIADSFVALFASIHKDVKDKFMSEYPDCLAQSIYATYMEAFPESETKFDDQFKQELVYLIHEWVTGLKPVPGTWKRWDDKRLQPKVAGDEASAAAKQMMQAAALNKEVALSLDMESFNKVMDKMGQEQGVSSGTPLGMLREVTKVTNATTQTTLPSSSQSRLPYRSPPKESHQIGPGPEYERVKFNTKGRSPLISHYLHMRQLRHYKQAGREVRRTEISKEPPSGQTYQQLIHNTLALSDALNKEYQRICEETNNEIYELERKKRDMNREIDSLQKELLFTRNPLDLKILSERIMELKDRDRMTPLLTTDRDTPQLSDDSSISDDDSVEEKE
ncbi:protein FAM227B-like [Haliotis rufescens]|uniref:protein FAM227B-like n=1 Tax=Haliotis rufescens TaxID=6454 RepID=UPI00201FB278|nr:protein FAM227B-like [Haliotis rufescens]